MNHFSLKLRKILLYSPLYYLLLVFSFLYLIIYLNFYEIKSKYNINNTNFELKIIKYTIKNNKINIYFNNGIIGKYYLDNEEDVSNFKNTYSLGDIVYVNGKLVLPRNNTIPNTFNYKKYLNSKRIKYILNIKSIKIKTRNKNILLNIKNLMYKRINNIKYNQYLYAFILGDISYLDEEVYDNYKTNGITHLFALSGLHVSMFSSILIFILNKFKTGEKTSFIIVSLFLLFYSFIASFSPSILRATVFFILSSINKIYYLFIKPKHLLFITFILLIIINPLYIFNTGFILSFTISFFILLNNENKDKSSLLYISLISFFSSLPIIINMNYEINLIGFLNNLIFIPLVTYFIFPLSIITMFLPFLSPILNIACNIMEFVSNISSKIVNINICFSKINTIFIIIYYLLLILIIKKYKRVKVIFLILIFILYFKSYFNLNNYVYYIDVNQGDSSLIRIKNKTILIDTGGQINSKLMTNSIIPFMKSIGVKRINYYILSHGDYDHIGWSIDLINNFKVDEVIFNCGEYNKLENELISILNEKNIEYYSCINELNVNNNQLLFLNTKEYNDENNNSNVVYLELDNYKFLFMGDAGVEKEKDILNRYNISNIDVLKVGHHGSKTSSSKDFINEINPKYSIISVGKNNRYGHPNNEVLNNLKESKIYRTDEDGSIVFKIKKNKLKIEMYEP